VIVDEQQRFGVRQRQKLIAKARNPDLLLMTATPIPRTLAMTAYGDLNLSTIRTMPKGRRTTITHLAREGNESKVYERVRRELESGGQAYFVYPVIEGSADSDVKAAENMYGYLHSEVFPEYAAAIIHSRMDEELKRRRMAAFTAGDVRVLVATSVVEVGVDVSRATCMVVEHADRFGLSALHQLRGRVGRGARQSYAFLIFGKQLTEQGVRRLRIMMATNDGFRIAEEDLKIRGPGEMLGLKQSGFFNLKIADLMKDGDLLQEARQDVLCMLEDDPGLLRYPHLRELAGGD
jgi:ATP-dependent DNA helicase RecG